MADRPTPASTDSPEAGAVLERAVDAIIARCGEEIAVAASLGLGKPHRLFNALLRSRRVRGVASPAQPHRALSLEPPSPRGGLEQRYLSPFLARHFGVDLPRLRYVNAQKSAALPANVHVEVFHLQSGASL